MIRTLEVTKKEKVDKSSTCEQYCVQEVAINLSESAIDFSYDGSVR